MKRILFLSMLCVAAMGMWASTLKGIVIDQYAQPIAGTLITCQSYDDPTLTLCTTTGDSEGNWELTYENDWKQIRITITADGYTSFSFYWDSSNSMNPSPKLVFRLINGIDYQEGMRSTIILPVDPDPSWGRYYRLDHEEGNKLVFEREQTPKAYVPYIFFPSQTFHLDISGMDLSGHIDPVRSEHVTFYGFFNVNFSYDVPESLMSYTPDEQLPYVLYKEEGYGEFAMNQSPMHAILEWYYGDFTIDDIPVEPELVFHDPEEPTYHPYVEKNKMWRSVSLSWGKQPEFATSYFTDKEVTIDGHVYMVKYLQEDGEEEGVENGYYREEDKHVYEYYLRKDRPSYNFALEEGEEFSFDMGAGTDQFVVTNVGELVLNGQHLKTITFVSKTMGYSKTWTEGIGGPLSIAAPTTPIYGSTAYVAGDSPNSYLPLSFSVSGYNHTVHGQQLVVGEECPGDYSTSLNYELVDDSLHVWGRMLVNAGPNHYIFCVDEMGDNCRKLTLKYEEVEPIVDRECTRMVDFYIPGFSRSATYIMVDETGEHVVPRYAKFVQPGKTWRVVGSNMAHAHRTIDYSFSSQDAVETINGHNYLPMKASYSDGGSIDCGLFREENHKVYYYDEKAGREYLFYDFTLQEGDRFEPEYGDLTNCEVIKVERIQVNGVWLRKIIIEGNDRNSDAAVRVRKTWLEDVGTLSGPLGGLSGPKVSSWSYSLCYVVEPGSPEESYLPFTFNQMNGWHGQQLVKLEEMDWEDINPHWDDMLQYELLPDSAFEDGDVLTLHVSGYMDVQCGPNNYVYCAVESKDISSSTVKLQIDELEPTMDCTSWCKVDMYFPYFQNGKTYIAIDSRGEHVIQPAADRRPFIEEGKEWTVARGMQGGEPSHWGSQDILVYKLVGDTIVGNRVCTRLVRYPANDTTDITYEGALYELDRSVYLAEPGRQTFKLLYNFNLREGETITTDDGQIWEVLKYGRMEDAYYKGCSVSLQPKDRTDVPAIVWREGVGSSSAPWDNGLELAPTGLTTTTLLMCTKGDEMFYVDTLLINHFIDSGQGEVKKQWLDFTHTVKTRPKSPRRRGSGPWIMDNGQWTVDNGQWAMNGAATASDSESEEENLTGEYSDAELLVSLVPLKGSYTVTLTNAAGEEVYAKTVQTSSVVALNTDLSKYPAGSYTLTVENADEAYTAALSIGEGNGIREIEDEGWNNDKGHSSIFNPHSSIYYDLSGRRLSAPPVRGLYIQDGKIKTLSPLFRS